MSLLVLFFVSWFPPTVSGQCVGTVYRTEINSVQQEEPREGPGFDRNSLELAHTFAGIFYRKIICPFVCFEISLKCTNYMSYDQKYFHYVDNE